MYLLTPWVLVVVGFAIALAVLGWKRRGDARKLLRDQKGPSHPQTFEKK